MCKITSQGLRYAKTYARGNGEVKRNSKTIAVIESGFDFAGGCAGYIANTTALNRFFYYKSHVKSYALN